MKLWSIDSFCLTLAWDMDSRFIRFMNDENKGHDGFIRSDRLYLGDHKIADKKILRLEGKNVDRYPNENLIG